MLSYHVYIDTTYVYSLYIVRFATQAKLKKIMLQS